MNKRILAIFISLGVMGLMMGVIALISLQGEADDGLALPTLAQLMTEEPVAAVQHVTSTPLPVITVEVTEAAVMATATDIETVEIAGVIPAEDAAVPAQMVINFDSATSAIERRQYIAAIGGVAGEIIDGLDSVVVNFPAGDMPEVLPGSDLVLKAEPNYYVTALQRPVDDPLYGQQWALPVIGIPEVWPQLQGTGTGAVFVAVIDSGICDHEDLNGRVLAGYDFVEGDNDPQDEFGHGCGVAGVIAANTYNGVGIAGAALNTQIIPLRVLDAQGLGTYAHVAQAIVYAVDNGADIINVSLGGTADSQLMRSAIDYAVSRGVMIIAAAGNSGQAGTLYPAAYTDVIAVGAVDETLQPSRFSNYGPDIDLWGPGSNILSLAADNQYRLFSGTSFAAPYVSAVAAVELHLGRTLVIHGDIVAVGGRAYEEPSLEPPAIPVNDVIVAEDGPALFLQTDAQGALNVEDSLGVLRTRYAEINFAALSTNLAAGAQSVRQDAIHLNLFDDVALVAAFQQVTGHSVFENGFIWEGNIAGDVQGGVILVVGEGQVSGRVVVDERTYQIRYAGNGVHAIHEVDADSYRLPHSPPAVPDDGQMVDDGQAIPEASANNIAIIDLMVVYSPRARAALDAFGIVNDIELATMITNQIFKNSGVNARFNLVHVEEVGLVEGPTLTHDLYEMTSYTGSWGQAVRMMRDLYGADIVTLVTDTNPYASCGVGWVMQQPNAPNRDIYGFNVVEAACLWNGLTLAHEIGHNMGLAHDRANAGVGGAYPYAYGYADPQRRFVTVMTYANAANCTAGRGCIQLGRFSSATQRIGDLPLGNATTDNVRALNNTAHIVAGFRNSVTPVIMTPTPEPDIIEVSTPAPNTGTLNCHFNVPAGAGSVNLLRNVITAANLQEGMTHICLQDGTYTVTDAPYMLPGDSSRNAFPPVTGIIRIIGNGATIERQGSTLFRFFQLDGENAQLILQDITLKNGYLPYNQHGGAIDANNGVVALENAALINNTADQGGAIANGAFIEVTDSEITGNLARYGAAIYTHASIYIGNSLINDNYSSINLGAVIDHQGTDGFITNSCIINNGPIAVSTTNSLDAWLNWWGAANGPTLPYSGLDAIYGDTVAGNVLYDPFRTVPVAACEARPGLVQLQSPPANLITNDVQPEFAWSAGAGDHLYNLQIANNSGFQGNILTFNNLSDTHFMPETALEGGIWYWRVRASINGRAGNWSAHRQLTIDLIPPTVPDPLRPIDSSGTTNTRPTFTWARVSDAVEYEIQLDTVNPPIATYSSNVPSFRPVLGMLISPYYWRVRARDLAGNWSAWSAVFHLDIESPANALPQRNYYTQNTPTLTWSRMPWATNYELVVSTVANFRTLEFSSIVDRNHLGVTTDALPSGVYYWRVRAQMANGRWGAWSVTDSFTIDAP